MVFIPALIVRSVIRKEGFRTLERLGIYPDDAKCSCIWIHAVSVGELKASVPIIEKLLQSKGSPKLLITTTTITASSLVEKAFGERVEHVFFPYDIPLILRSLFRKYNPRKLILLETELWPNLLRLCLKQEIPVFLINARLSEHSFKRYQILYSLMSEELGSITKIGAQNSEYAERFLKIGYSKDTIQITGNLKFENNYDSVRSDELTSLFARSFCQKRILICGSTRRGEEARLMPVLKSLAQRFENLLIVIAPRHPKRAKEIGEICARTGLKYHYRSAQWIWENAPTVLILDTIGELSSCYSISHVAFVGGSLEPFGGQNVLEPSYFGVPTLVGPHTANFQEEVKALSAIGALQIIADETEFFSEVTYLLENDQKRRELGLRARRFIKAQRGPLNRTLAMLNELDK